MGGDGTRRLRAGGAGLTIRHGWFDSPFGAALVMGTDRGLCGLGFAAETGAEAAMADLTGRWPAAQFVEDRAALAPMVAKALARRRVRHGCT